MSTSTEFPRTQTSNQTAARQQLVLIAEDHDDTRAMLKTVLQMNGLNAVEAVNGIDAVRLARSERPDLILMDFTLPLLDGVSATRLIRADKISGNLPILFLSGHAEPAPREAALRAGCNGFVVKPFDLGELMTLIKRTLSKLEEHKGEAHFDRRSGDGRRSRRDFGSV